VGSCQHGSECHGSIKDKEFTEQLCDYQLLSMELAFENGLWILLNTTAELYTAVTTCVRYSGKLNLN